MEEQARAAQAKQPFSEYINKLDPKQEFEKLSALQKTKIPRGMNQDKLNEYFQKEMSLVRDEAKVRSDETSELA